MSKAQSYFDDYPILDWGLANDEDVQRVFYSSPEKRTAWDRIQEREESKIKKQLNNTAENECRKSRL